MRSLNRPPSEYQPTSPPLPENDPGNPTDTEQTAADQQNRVHDLETLGKSFMVRRTIDKHVGNAISAAHEKTAKFKNLMSTPKNMYLRSRHDAAQDKLERRRLKLDSSHFNFINKHHKNKFDKAQAKATARERAFNGHTDLMQGRLDRAAGVRKKHETLTRKNLDMYRDRKALAQGSKELRRMRREMRKSGKSRLETNRALSGMTAEQRIKLGRLACQQEVAQRQLNRSQKQREKITKTANKQSEQLNSAVESLNDLSEKTEKTRKQKKDAEEVKNEYTDKLTSLHEELDGVDPDDTERRAELEEEIAEEESGLARIEAIIKEADENIALYNRESERHRKAARNANQYLGHLESQYRSADADTEQHADTLNDIRDQYKAASRVQTPSAQSEQQPAPTLAPAPVTPPTPPAPQPVPLPNADERQAGQQQSNPDDGAAAA